MSIRSLLVHLTGGQLLMPSSVVAEVLSYHEPEDKREKPAWLIGMMKWRGETIPLTSIEKMLGIEATQEPSKEQRIIILYGIYTPQTLPFYAILSKDMPTSITVGVEAQQNPKPVKKDGISASVVVENKTAWLPDFEYLENLFQQAI
jgi:chemosensory pili system protein ChpC